LSDFPIVISGITMTAQILDGNALGQKLRAGFKQKAEELAAQGAVSYTHLTLPTIYSV